MRFAPVFYNAKKCQVSGRNQHPPKIVLELNKGLSRDVVLQRATGENNLTIKKLFIKCCKRLCMRTEQGIMN